MFHQFQSVIAKLGNMKKAQDFTICPVSTNEPDQITIQSDKRIAQVNLTTKKVILSDGKGGHQGFLKLLPILGAKEYDCPQDVIDQILQGLERAPDLKTGVVVIPA